MQKDGKTHTVMAKVVPDLPISIISDILARLLVDDVARCKCVSKGWYNLSKDSHFTHLHFTKSSQERNSILLWESGKYGFFDNFIEVGGLYLISNRDEEEDGKWNTINISVDINIRGFAVGSCNGLLCINTHYCYSEGPNLVYNPLTKDAIALLELEFHPDYDRGHGYRCAFGFDPTNNKYKVALAYLRKCYLDDKPRCFILKMTGAIITLGEASWRTLQFPHDFETNILNRESLFFNGAFHWVIGKRYGKDNTRLDGILHMDISTENFQIVMFSPSVEIPHAHLEQIQLENSLTFVHNHRGGASLEIWQIKGANTNGSCLYKHWTFNVHVEGYPLINDLQGFRLLGAFGNGVFLFKAHQTPTRGEPLHNYLVLFDVKKDEGSVIEISGAPKSSSASIFPPSFIYPTL